MSFALYLDEHIDPLLAPLLRQLGHDVLTTVEAGKHTQSDEDQFAFAAATGRAILTFDTRDYYRLSSLWNRAGRQHSGVIAARKASATELRDRVLLLFDAYPDGIANLAVSLPRQR